MKARLVMISAVLLAGSSVCLLRADDKSDHSAAPGASASAPSAESHGASPPAEASRPAPPPQAAQAGREDHGDRGGAGPSAPHEDRGQREAGGGGDDSHREHHEDRRQQQTASSPPAVTPTVDEPANYTPSDQGTATVSNDPSNSSQNTKRKKRHHSMDELVGQMGDLSNSY